MLAVVYTTALIQTSHRFCYLLSSTVLFPQHPFSIPPQFARDQLTSNSTTHRRFLPDSVGNENPSDEERDEFMQLLDRVPRISLDVPYYKAARSGLLVTKASFKGCRKRWRNFTPLQCLQADIRARKYVNIERADSKMKTVLAHGELFSMTLRPV